MGVRFCIKYCVISTYIISSTINISMTKQYFELWFFTKKTCNSYNIIYFMANPDGHASLGVGLKALDCWDHSQRHGCSSVVFIVCCVGSSLCDELTTHSEESWGGGGGLRVCVCVCVFIYIYIYIIVGDPETSTMREK
jgi:hypothetical protein